MKKIVVGYLYGDCMNIYGDTGNIIALKNRCKKRGVELVVEEISVGYQLKPKKIDIYFFGGGQDQAQELVAKDLVSTGKGEVIKEDVERGVPLLSVCGGYQLLGEYYQPHKGPKIEGTGLFRAYTEASFDRMIGNIVITSQFGDLVGFENHSGKTYLKSGSLPFGMVLKGFGNNGSDKTEGCIYKNAIGCYMHGSLLPKNPILCDWLIKKALEVKYQEVVELEYLDDGLENLAHHKAIARFG